MFTLENIIDSKAGREIKRAIAVKMVSQGFSSCKFFRDGILAYTNTQNYINLT